MGKPPQLTEGKTRENESGSLGWRGAELLLPSIHAYSTSATTTRAPGTQDLDV
jgi:hypothetical protein